ncbi:MAG TPA: hypothetical protein VL068_02120, partial [Microthrixaceae bacterium]|nr:hypothetical protein [Microthrixaceae bacterium]
GGLTGLAGLAVIAEGRVIYIVIAAVSEGHAVVKIVAVECSVFGAVPIARVVVGVSGPGILHGEEANPRFAADAFANLSIAPLTVTTACDSGDDRSAARQPTPIAAVHAASLEKYDLST